MGAERLLCRAQALRPEKDCSRAAKGATGGLQIFVSGGLDGGSRAVEVQPDATVGDLRRAAAEALAITDLAGFALQHQGMELGAEQDAQELSDLGLGAEAVVSVVQSMAPWRFCKEITHPTCQGCEHYDVLNEGLTGLKARQKQSIYDLLANPMVEDARTMVVTFRIASLSGGYCNMMTWSPAKGCDAVGIRACTGQTLRHHIAILLREGHCRVNGKLMGEVGVPEEGDRLQFIFDIAAKQITYKRFPRQGGDVHVVGPCSTADWPEARCGQFRPGVYVRHTGWSFTFV
eukprot:TRINITY_DN2823_c0_g1_i2.p2 TRINITY_DN2823_c0_g1~~TRINITY_DN2823_c0_g1_i2.p2  ORF type:complete len:321 (+),score=73.21 TRINITY_DN2823_c0_g1_i2:97-963(+)